MRAPLIVGNWKMHKTASAAGPFVQELLRTVVVPTGVEVVLAPPFTALQAVRLALGEASPFGLAAQDVFWEEEGAFTGEVSATMLRDLDCHYVIIGHSERRHLFGESDEAVQRKVRAALRHNLRPILCVGETLDERDQKRTDVVVTRQLRGGLEGLGGEEVRRVTIAYEPVWAIGTGRAATVAQAEEVHDLLARTLRSLWSESAAGVRLLYGGSVTPDNAGQLLGSPRIDGALVGGACLKADAFAKIVAQAPAPAGS